MNFFQRVIASCAGFRTYRPFLDQPVGRSVLYLLGLMALLCALLVISFVPRALRYGDTFGQWVNNKVKPFEIRDGKTLATFDQPYRTGGSDFLLIVDTTGVVTGPVFEAERGILFQEHEAQFWSLLSTNPKPVWYTAKDSLKGLPDGTINGDYVHRLVKFYLLIGVPLSIVLLTLGGTVLCMLQSYLFSIIVSFMERQLSNPLTISQLINISIHATTPAAIIVTVYSLFRLEGLDFWLIYLVAYGVFLIGASNACRDRSQAGREEDFD